MMQDNKLIKKVVNNTLGKDTVFQIWWYYPMEF